MAFQQIPTRTPTGIGDVEVTLFSPDPNGDDVPGAQFKVWVHYSDGSGRPTSGDLVPHLTQQQTTALLAFMDAMRVKAVAEILP